MLTKQDQKTEYRRKIRSQKEPIGDIDVWSERDFNTYIILFKRIKEKEDKRDEKFQ